MNRFSDLLDDAASGSPDHALDVREVVERGRRRLVRRRVLGTGVLGLVAVAATTAALVLPLGGHGRTGEELPPVERSDEPVVTRTIDLSRATTAREGTDFEVLVSTPPLSATTEAALFLDGSEELGLMRGRTSGSPNTPGARSGSDGTSPWTWRGLDTGDEATVTPPAQLATFSAASPTFSLATTLSTATMSVDAIHVSRDGSTWVTTQVPETITGGVMKVQHEAARDRVWLQASREDLDTGSFVPSDLWSMKVEADGSLTDLRREVEGLESHVLAGNRLVWTNDVWDAPRFSVRALDSGRTKEFVPDLAPGCHGRAFDAADFLVMVQACNGGDGPTRADVFTWDGELMARVDAPAGGSLSARTAPGNRTVLLDVGAAEGSDDDGAGSFVLDPRSGKVWRLPVEDPSWVRPQPRADDTFVWADGADDVSDAASRDVDLTWVAARWLR